MKIKDCKLIKVDTCSKQDTLTKVAGQFKTTKSRYILVTENKTPLGIISASDMIHKAVAEHKDPKTTKAEDIMTKPLFVLKESEEVHNAFVAMVKKGLNSCPVIDNKNQCVGALTLLEAISTLNKNAVRK